MDNDVRLKLNNIVQMYLIDGEFKETSEVFRAECQKLGQFGSTEDQQSKIVNDDIEKLVKLFDAGAKDAFFEAFQTVVPSGNSDDNQNQEYLQLECHLQLHFAVFGLTDLNDEDVAKLKLESGMQEFKQYLESRGSLLSKESDYLSYFALPFIENPTQHVSFTELFQESWVERVRNELKSYMVKYGVKTVKPETVKLATLYEQHQHYNQLEKLIDAIQNELKLKNDDLAKLQMNYQNLMKVTVELLSTLEMMVKGDEVNLSNVVEICLTAFPDLFPSNFEVSKILSHSVTTESIATTEKTVSELNRNYSLYRSKAYHWNLVNLDYKKLKQDLVSGPLRLKIFILQALRWRLTRSPPGLKRRSVLQDYIHNDLLGVQGGIYNSSISQLILSPISELRQTMLRLLNSFASLSIGRSYLAQKSGILSSMMDSVIFDKLEQLSLDMALAALQKLSLRRELQSAMIQRDVIEKLIVLIRDGEFLSDYSLEYVVALLMNLCLRSAGKQRCAKQPVQVLKVLTNLLGTQNQDVIQSVFALNALLDTYRCLLI
ncbi:LisH domain-containing protein armc9 [Chamberlinius hualienensis]